MLYKAKKICIIISAAKQKMAPVEKRPNSPDCGSGIRAFESRQAPHFIIKALIFIIKVILFLIDIMIYL